jgi:hypothetical protein
MSVDGPALFPHHGSVRPIINFHLEGSTMSFLRFWSDLNVWNKYGISAVGALAIIAILLWLVA